MTHRVPVVAANWKMHMTIAEAEGFLTAFLPRVGDVRGTEIVLCPPYLALKAVVELCVQTRIKVAAQNMHEEQQGAWASWRKGVLKIPAEEMADLAGRIGRRVGLIYPA